RLEGRAGIEVGLVDQDARPGEVAGGIEVQKAIGGDADADVAVVAEALHAVGAEALDLEGVDGPAVPARDDHASDAAAGVDDGRLHGAGAEVEDVELDLHLDVGHPALDVEEPEAVADRPESRADGAVDD